MHSKDGHRAAHPSVCPHRVVSSTCVGIAQPYEYRRQWNLVIPESDTATKAWWRGRHTSQRLLRVPATEFMRKCTQLCPGHSVPGPKPQVPIGSAECTHWGGQLYLLVFILRQVSFCSSGLAWNSQFSCFSLQSAGITGMHHHTLFGGQL
jgi:hypothetical protein